MSDGSPKKPEDSTPPQVLQPETSQPGAVNNNVNVGLQLGGVHPLVAAKITSDHISQDIAIRAQAEGHGFSLAMKEIEDVDREREREHKRFLRDRDDHALRDKLLLRSAIAGGLGVLAIAALLIGLGHVDAAMALLNKAGTAAALVFGGYGVATRRRKSVRERRKDDDDEE